MFDVELPFDSLKTQSLSLDYKISGAFSLHNDRDTHDGQLFEEQIY